MPTTAQTSVSESGSSKLLIISLIGCAGCLLMLMCCCVIMFLLPALSPGLQPDLRGDLWPSIPDVSPTETSKPTATVKPTVTKAQQNPPADEPEGNSDDYHALSGTVTLDVTNVNLYDGRIMYFEITDSNDETLVRTNEFTYSSDLVSVDSQGNATLSFEADRFYYTDSELPLYVKLFEIVPDSEGNPNPYLVVSTGLNLDQE